MSKKRIKKRRVPQIKALVLLAKLDNGKIHQVVLNKEQERTIFQTVNILCNPIKLLEESVDTLTIETYETKKENNK